MSCQECGRVLEEISLQQALEHTRKNLLRKIAKKKDFKALDPQTQYIIASYFGDHSLFLFFDMNKNHMKYGKKVMRFFIQPINMTCVFNIPWFLFNVIYSNYFHFFYTSFCTTCQCKHIPGRHSAQECEYNLGYFHILRDVLNGNIIQTKKIYQKYFEKDKRQHRRNPYQDLCRRPVRTETFLDLLSIGFSVFLWIYLAVYVSFPMAKSLVQKLHDSDTYEWSLFN